jgi:transcriptional regulator with XRE-family HTH domain
MGLDFSNPESLKELGAAIRKKRESIGWTQLTLAGKSRCSDRIIRNIEGGRKTRPSILCRVCEALGISFEDYNANYNAISDEKYGAYSLDHFNDYIGIYFGYRRGLSHQINFLRTVYEISWSDKKRCLEFFEDHKYTSSDGELIDHSQRGDIYISNEIGLLHFLTSKKGAIRLVTLSKLSRPANILQGVVLTQLVDAIHYSPAVAPIYLQKVSDAPNRSELASIIGPISPAHEEYQTIAARIEEVERKVVYFPLVSSLDPKVTRISSRVSEPRRDGTSEA